MSRFFVEAASIDKANGEIIIAGEDVRHIRNVLRGRPGDELILSDGAGTDYHVRIRIVEKERVVTDISGFELNKSEPSISITLLQGIPKADKMEYILQKSVELGVEKVVPVMTARTVVKYSDIRVLDSKIARWRRIALEAAKQSDRGIVPRILEPIPFEEAVIMVKDSSLKIFPYEKEKVGDLKTNLSAYKERRPVGRKGPETKEGSNVSDLALLIGPEGGFTPEEAGYAIKHGFSPVTLGPRILRTETAGVAVMAIVMYELGGMEGLK